MNVFSMRLSLEYCGCDSSHQGFDWCAGTVYGQHNDGSAGAKLENLVFLGENLSSHSSRVEGVG